MASPTSSGWGGTIEAVQTVSDELFGERASRLAAGGTRANEPGEPDGGGPARSDNGLGEPTSLSQIDLRRPNLETAAKELADDVIDLADRRAADLFEQAEATAAALLEAAEERARTMTETAEAQVAAAEARLADLLELTASVEEVGAEAAEIRRRAEEAAAEILDEAWTTSSLLQEEMLREAEEHVREVLRQADASVPHVMTGLPPGAGDSGSAPSAGERGAGPVGLPFAEPSFGFLRRLRKRLPRPRTLLRVGLPLLIGLLATRAFLFAPYAISSTSMEPTIADGDRVLVNKVDYRASEPRRGDIVLIEAPPGWAIGDELVKRVVAVAGDTAEARDGRLRVNGTALDESYLPAGSTTADFDPIDVPDGYVFVLGDNRAESVDSRAFGPIPEGTVTARVDAVIWPLSDARVL